MRTQTLMVSLLVLAFSALGVIFACSDSGCDDGYREFNGKCVPESSSDGDMTDGDIILPVDGDRTTTDGDVTDEVTGTGICSDPFVHGPDGRSSPISGSGRMNPDAADVQGAPCAMLNDGEVDGDSDGSSLVLAAGPEIVVKIMLNQGDTITVEFGGQSFDSIVYILRNECGSQSTCDNYSDNDGPGQPETVQFTAEITADYFIVMDTRNETANGDYSYTITLTDSTGDGDVTDGDTTDGDVTDGDTTDGDTTDGDNDGEMELQFIGVDQEHHPPEGPVTGTFTDLAWKVAGENQQLVLVNDTGIVLWDWQNEASIFTDSPIQSEQESAYRGVAFAPDSVLPLYLDMTNRVITDGSNKIDLPAGFGTVGSGLAAPAEDVFWATEAASKMAYKMTKAEGSDAYEHTTFDYSAFTDLAGTTYANGYLLLLDAEPNRSIIYIIDQETGGIRSGWQLGNEQLADIAYNPATNRIWAVRKNTRDVLLLTPFGPFSSAE